MSIVEINDINLPIKVLDLGFVRYVDHMGTDQRILDAARVSYQSTSKGDYQDKKLLEYLFKNRHTSPFEQCQVTFHIKMPIFCHRQYVRQLLLAGMQVLLYNDKYGNRNNTNKR